MLIEIRTLPNVYRPSKPKRILVLKCDECGCVFERPYTQNYLDRHKWGQFHSRKCYGQFKSKHPELYVENTAKMHLPGVGNKISVSRLETTRAPGYVHNQTGLKRNEATLVLLRQRKAENPPSGEKNGMWGRRHRIDSREKMSNIRSQQILDGTAKIYPGNSKHGTYVSKNGRELAFKSGWEESMMRWLDTSVDVATWEYEQVRIPYVYDKHKRWYVPDFIVTFIDGHREMWEVKPKFHRNAERVLLKAEAARSWCAQNGLVLYRVLTGDELKQMSVL